MGKDLDRDQQYVGLPTACSVIYAKIMGKPPATEPAEMQEVLNAVARAVSNVVPVYSRGADGSLPVPLTAIDLINGKFERGAHAFALKDGRQLTGLSLQRPDMHTAISVLQSAHITFRAPRLG